jgi:hypothetical protein
MHPDILRETSPVRGPLSRDDSEELSQVDAVRRLLERTDRYPRCPRCWRALVAQTPTRLACPNGHVTIALPAHSRWQTFWRRVRVVLAGVPLVGIRRGQHT